MTRDELTLEVMRKAKAFLGNRYAVRRYRGPEEEKVAAAITVLYPSNAEWYGVEPLVANVAVRREEVNNPRLGDAIEARCVAAKIVIGEQLAKFYLNVMQARAVEPRLLEGAAFDKVMDDVGRKEESGELISGHLKGE